MKIRKYSPFPRLVRYFFQGLLYIAPISVTIWAILLVFNYVDDAVVVHIERLAGFKIPGLGVVTLLAVITFMGFLGSTFVFRPFMRYFDYVISRAPLIKIIYSAVKDFMQAFVGQQKKFTEPVMVKLHPEYGIERMGFITSHDLSHLGTGQEKVAVYFPSSYTVLGELYFVPETLVRALKVSPAEAMKYVISGGVTRLSGNPGEPKDTKEKVNSAV